MPRQDQIQGSQTPKEDIRDFFKTTNNENLAKEVSALRKEIFELRTQLAPIPSLIITGKDVLEEFKKLSYKNAASLSVVRSNGVL